MFALFLANGYDLNQAPIYLQIAILLFFRSSILSSILQILLQITPSNLESKMKMYTL